MYKVYILLCSDFSFYVGHTDNIKRRLKEHKNLRGASYLKRKLPVKLAYFEDFLNRPDAVRRER